MFQRIPFLPLAAVLACGPSVEEHGHSHGAEAEQAHGEEAGESIARTRFTETHEMFVELDAPVAGHPYAYHAHVTRLADNHAATGGSLELRFEQGGFVVETHTDPQPARRGIFAGTAPAPSEPGTYRLKAVYTSGEERAAWDLGEIRVGDEEPIPHQPEPEGEVAFLKEAQWVVPFAVALPVEQAIAPPLTLAAVVEVDPRASAVFAAPAEGVVVWGDGGTIPVEGLAVTAGQVLGHLVPGGSDEHYARLQAGAETARIDVAVAEAELDRVEALVADGLLPEKRLLEARAAVETARAQRTASARQLGGGTAVPIRAPRDGVVTRLLASHGADVEAGAPLLSVGGGEAIVIRGHLLGRDLGTLDPVSWATVQRGDWEEPKDLLALGGRVLTERVVVDPSTMSAPVAAWLPGRAGLRPGDLVELGIGVGTGERHLTVPREAIVEVDTRPAVFVMVSGETFARRPVVLGPADAERVAVVSGLSPDDRVVVEGGFDVHVASLGGAIESHRH